MTKVLVNADDFGLSRNATDSIASAVRAGCVRGVSVLVNGEDAERALSLCPSLKGVRISLHINLTEGPSLGGHAALPLLTRENGSFRYSVGKLWFSYVCSLPRRRAQLRKEVREEFERQRDLFARRSGIAGPLVVDGHQHVHMIPFVFDEITRNAGIGRIRLPIEPLYAVRSRIGELCCVHSIARIVLNVLGNAAKQVCAMRDIAFNEYVIGISYSGRMTKETILAGLAALPENASVEVIVHPGSVLPNELLMPEWNHANLTWYRSPWREREHACLQTISSEDLERYVGTSTLRKRLVRIVRFIVSGTTAALTTLSLLYILTEWFGLWYLFSAIVALAVSICVGFVLQKYWTFTDRTPLSRAQFGLFVLLNIWNSGINALLLYVLVEYVHIWYILAEILAAGSIAVWSFCIMHFVIFNRSKRV